MALVYLLRFPCSPAPFPPFNKKKDARADEQHDLNGHSTAIAIYEDSWYLFLAPFLAGLPGPEAGGNSLESYI